MLCGNMEQHRNGTKYRRQPPKAHSSCCRRYPESAAAGVINENTHQHTQVLQRSRGSKLGKNAGEIKKLPFVRLDSPKYKGQFLLSGSKRFKDSDRHAHATSLPSSDTLYLIWRSWVSYPFPELI